MRKLTLALLGSLLLCTAAAALAVEPAATDLFTPATTAAPQGTSPAPISLLPATPQDKINVCPPEPVVSCNSCFDFGVWTSYQCTLYCVDGVAHRSCSFCGSGCPL
jgi:hypothetical protein